MGKTGPKSRTWDEIWKDMETGMIDTRTKDTLIYISSDRRH